MQVFVYGSPELYACALWRARKTMLNQADIFVFLPFLIYSVSHLVSCFVSILISQPFEVFGMADMAWNEDAIKYLWLNSDTSCNFTAHRGNQQNTLCGGKLKGLEVKSVLVNSVRMVGDFMFFGNRVVEGSTVHKPRTNFSLNHPYSIPYSHTECSEWWSCRIGPAKRWCFPIGYCLIVLLGRRVCLRHIQNQHIAADFTLLTHAVPLWPATATWKDH